MVKDLIRSLVGGYNTVYCDSLFNSIALFNGLLKNGIHACRTLKANRKEYPEKLKKYH